jgi:hypothetical protein
METFNRVVAGVMAVAAIAGRAITQTARATARNLEIDYFHSPPYCGVIEAFRNFTQALQRERARLRTVGGVRQEDVAEFRVAVIPMTLTDRRGNTKVVVKNGYLNSAPPMTATELRDYFTHIGESGNTTWRPDNRGGSYGQGLRQAELFPNPAGLFIIAVDADNLDDSSMMWLAYDPVAEEYKALQLPEKIEEYPDGSRQVVSDIVVPIGVLESGEWQFDPREFITEPLRKFGGMVFVRFGADLLQHTALEPSPNGEKWGADLEARVGERIYDAGRIAIETLMPDDAAKKYGGRKLTIDGKAYRVDVRWLKSHDGWFNRKGVQFEDLQHLDGTRIRVAMVDAGIAGDGARHVAPKPGGFIEIRYGNEVYDVYSGLGSLAAKLREFGIWHAEVAKRVAILIEPPAAVTGKEPFAVEQDKTRGGLRVVPGGAYISDSGKFREWADFVGQNLPAFVTEALLAAAAKERPRRDLYEVASRVWSVVSARLRASALATNPRGTEKGSPTGDTVRRPATSGSHAAAENGDIRGDIDGKGRFGGQSPGTGKPGTGQPGADSVTPSINGNTPAASSKSAADTQVLGRRDNGSHTGRKVERPSLPDPVWHETEDDFAAAVGDELRGYPVFYDITNRRVHFNATHTQFRHQVRYYAETWAREPRQVKIATYVPAVAQHAVRHAYVEVTLGIIMQTLLEVDDGAKRADDLRPDVLRVAIRGVMNVAPLIERMIWDEAKRRNNSAAYGPAKSAAVTAPPAPTSAPTADATPTTIA